MSKQKIVVALGGNAILTSDPTAQAQQQTVCETIERLMTLVEAGHQVIITHGNGPQVGNLLLQQIAANTPKNPALPLDTLGAMTQGSIGYWIKKALDEALMKRKMNTLSAALITQAIVDANDPAMLNPSKPIGPFYTEEEAKAAMERDHDVYKEDSGRGWRKVVPSPVPREIIEYPVIRQLVDAGVIVIAAGGGGISVVREGDKLVGVEAVIDKDLGASRLAALIEADRLIILTAVDTICLNFNTPDEIKLHHANVEELNKHIADNQFAPGSMLPKIKAAIEFVSSGANREAVITSLDQLENIGKGAGTIITA